MRRKRAKASRSKSQVSMAWASRTRVRAQAVSEGNSASVAGGCRARGTSVIHRCCSSFDATDRLRLGTGPHAFGLAAPGSCGEQTLARTLERAVSVQVVVDGAGGEVAEFAADLRDRAVPVGHEALGVAQFLRGHDAGTSALATPRPGGRHTLAHALADDIAFHLGEGGLDLQKGAARWRGGVHGRAQRAESDAALSERVDESDELAGEAAEPVEVEDDDDEDVAATQIVETRRQVGPIGRGAGGVILEHALATGVVEGVELAVEDLATFGGGDAGVTDEAHGVCSPEKPFISAFYRKEISSGLSGRKSIRSRACGVDCGRFPTKT